MVYMYHSFLIHSSADGHLGCSHVLAIINSDVMNSAHVSFRSGFLSVYAQECDCWVRTYNFKCSNCQCLPTVRIVSLWSLFITFHIPLHISHQALHTWSVIFFTSLLFHKCHNIVTVYCQFLRLHSLCYWCHILYFYLYYNPSLPCQYFSFK